MRSFPLSDKRFRTVLQAFLIAVALLATGQSLAASDAQRRDFKKALAAARQGHLDRQSGLTARLQDYPLYPYLQAIQLRAELRSGASSALDERIAAFLTRHDGLAPNKQLRSAWFASLAQRDQWQKIIDYTPASADTSQRCQVLQARIKQGAQPAEQARQLYVVGHSQPKACDPVFDWLEKSGNLTDWTIKRRAQKAIINGQTSLASYLARQTSGKTAAQIRQWVDLVSTPTKLAHAAPDLDGDVAVQAFKKLALSDVDKAARQIQPLVRRFNLDREQQQAMQRYVGLLYAQDQRPEAMLWFARLDHNQLNKADDDHALGWEARAAIYQQRWPLVQHAIDHMPAKMAKQEIWQYWKARALAKTGHKRQARAIFKRVAGTRSFYGYLAADILGQDYDLNERPVTARDKKAYQRVKSHPALQRAYEAHKLGLDGYAYLEWNQLQSDLSKTELAMAAKFASRWGWHARAITTLVKADYWDDLDIRYPTPFLAEVKDAASRHDLDPAYIMAIIRTESLFQPGIGSPAGAHGLMQLMPGTAAHLASQMGRARPSQQALSDPATNIIFGSRYLHDMMIDWSDNMALATASYNAGPGKIAQWLPRQATPADIWVTNIPYTETRKYVESVMTHMTAFQDRLSDSSITRLMDRMPQVKPDYPKSKHTTF